MQFKLSFIAALLTTAVASPVLISPVATSCAEDMVATLNQATSEVQGLNAQYNKINGPASALQEGPKIVGGMHSHIQTLAKTQNSNCEGHLSKQDQKEVCDAFENFAKADEVFMNTAAKKADFFRSTRFSAPIDANARVYEAQVNTLTFSIGDSAPTCGGSAKQFQKTLQNDAPSSSTQTSYGQVASPLVA